MEMKGSTFDQFLNELLAAKTFKEAKEIEKRYAKDYNQDEVIHAVMQYGRESEMAQAVAYVKDLEDKQPVTIRLRLAKFKHRARLFFYYHRARSIEL